MPRTRVVVAVPTYRRNALLARLLPMLLEQAREVDDAYEVEVLVVDNDPAGGARAVVDVGRYVHEPVPGISAARNRALDEAAAAELLVFIDDDEWPRAGWLRTLLEAHAAHRGAAVAGAVETDVRVALSDWLQVSGFFDRRRLPTGTAVAAAAANNLLLDVPWCAAHGLRFDDAFALTGGEDTHFTRSLVQLGGRIVWSNEAIVVETVTAERATRRWALAKAFSAGNGWSRSSIILAGGGPRRVVARLHALGQGLVRVFGGAAQFGLGAVTRSLRHRVLGVRSIVRGSGHLVGSLGVARDEYRRPGSTHG